MISSEIAEYFEKLPFMHRHFMGVYSIDTIPKTIPERKCLIFNLSKSYMMGSHWVSLARPESNLIEIFDSLGTQFDMLKPHLQFSKQFNYVYNLEPFQLPTSSTCGLFCITFLIERMCNLDLPFNEVLAEIFEINAEKNEDIVKTYCKNLLS